MMGQVDLLRSACAWAMLMHCMPGSTCLLSVSRAGRALLVPQGAMRKGGVCMEMRVKVKLMFLFRKQVISK